MAATQVPPLRVLVVDDDAGDVALIESAFAEQVASTEVHHAADGDEALAYLRRKPPHEQAVRPDVILLDLNMPRMDGRQVLSAVKTDDDLGAIPVVVFTTSSEPADIACSYAGHASAYVIKPIGLDDFGRVLAKIRDFYGSTATLPHPVRRP